jgi:CDP-6-deoxy-D-xylo-4-hexulose-3-dehydrase
MEQVPLATISLGGEEISAALDVLKSGNLTLGRQVEEFENEMAAYLGVKHFVMANSGSSANLLMFEALVRPARGEPRLRPGDGVFVPAIAWPTTIWPVVQLGLVPIFIDVEPETLAMDPVLIERYLKLSGLSMTKAMFLIHPLGLALDMERYFKLANEYGLTVISDVCESLGAKADSKPAGSGSLMSSFSFYFSHHITTMEGGGVGTNDDSIRNDLISMRSHGWSRGRSDSTQWLSNVSEADSRFQFVTTGYNLRPMEIQGAIGRVQLRKLSQFVETRKSLAVRVHNALNGGRLSLISGGAAPSMQRADHSWMLLPLRIQSDNPSADRHRLMSFLEGKGIATRPVLTGNFLSQPAVRQIFQTWPHPKNFVQAERVSQSAFLVGAHHEFSESQIIHLEASLVEASKLLS